MISFITVDLPEPFGPIRPRISPARDAERHVLDGDQAAEALGEAVDLEMRSSAMLSAGSLLRVSRPKKPLGKNSTTTSAMAKTTKFDRSPSGRSSSLIGDQEDRAEHARRGWCAGRRAPRR